MSRRLDEIRRIAREARPNAAALARRRQKYHMTLDDIRAKFALDPTRAALPTARELREQVSVRASHGVKAAEDMIGAPRALQIDFETRHPALLLTPKRKKRTDFRTAEDTSPQWVRELRAAYCDHFIKTGELDQEMAGKLRAYADACHTGEVLQGPQHADRRSDERIHRSKRSRASGVLDPSSVPIQRSE